MCECDVKSNNHTAFSFQPRTFSRLMRGNISFFNERFIIYSLACENNCIWTQSLAYLTLLAAKYVVCGFFFTFNKMSFLICYSQYVYQYIYMFINIYWWLWQFVGLFGHKIFLGFSVGHFDERRFISSTGGPGHPCIKGHSCPKKWCHRLRLDPLPSWHLRSGLFLFMIHSVTDLGFSVI